MNDGSAQKFEAWMNEFSQKFKMYFLPRNVSLLSFENEVMERFRAVALQLSEQDRLFFRISLHLYVLRTAIEQTSERMNDRRWMRDFTTMIDKLMAKLKSLFDLLNERQLFAVRANADSATLVQALADMKMWSALFAFVRERQYVPATRHFSWLTVYLMMLFYVDTPKDIHTSEWERLESLPDIGGDEFSTYVLLMRAANDLNRGEALQSLQRILDAIGTAGNLVRTEWMLLFFGFFRERSNGDARRDWLLALAEAGFHSDLDQKRLLLDQWLTIPEEQLTDEQHELVLRVTWPSSYRLYADFLTKRQRDQEWLALWISLSHDIDRQMPEVPSAIKDHHPELLLVVYHQQLELGLATKRLSHIECRTLFRMIRKLYLRLGQIDRWQHFTACFKWKYKRSRTLLRVISEMETKME